ncbi:MAG TPA: bacteriohopanetetrol glucosamine biosynthesis glycosyltransferase HpnI [Terriglobales bacterium]|nr:bacteriohopanetetrol glucosamine biosynthesis glycosyltransferase HpnI [Terriglobales bacterium]
MAQWFATSLGFAFGALAVCGCGYYVLCLWSVRAFRRECPAREVAAFTPPVSILKPLRGADPHMLECFQSHCRQDYPEYEIIFGVSESDDPAIALVQELKREFPERRIELVHCSERLGTNLKVSNLVQMLPHARFDHLVVNDSDIRVGQEYLRNIMAPFSDASTGMVTTPYRGVPGATFGSKLEALGISTDFIPGVLAARVVDGGIHFGLGSTLAIKRASLDAIGGFEPLLDYLADDFELGKRIADAGYKVVLSHEVVDTYLPDYRFGEYWKHQQRWMRSIRDSRGAGYAGLIFTFGLPFALAALLVSGGAAWSWAVAGCALLLRFCAAYSVAVQYLRDSKIVSYFWMIPLRDVLVVTLWITGYFKNSVTWRGDEFTLKDGKLARQAEP